MADDRERFEDPRFPGGSPSGLPPSPSRENPGQVFPPSDPSKSVSPPPSRATPDLFIGNPFLMRGALDKVNRALLEVILILEQEGDAQGTSQEENALLRKFREWREELDQIRAGEGSRVLKSEVEDIQRPLSRPNTQEGGMFTD